MIEDINKAGMCTQSGREYDKSLQQIGNRKSRCVLAVTAIRVEIGG